jgi:hypothetical protein
MRRVMQSVALMMGLLGPAGLDAQQGDVYKGRFAAMPVTAVTAPTMKGSGSVSAVLKGNTLTVSGKFEGLSSPVTMAHVHRARPGMRGPNVFDLTVTKATSGTIEAALTLTPAQVDEVRKGWYYVQLHTEKNPEGHLRAWLLK